MGHLNKYNTHRTTDHLTFDIEDGGLRVIRLIVSKL